MVESLQIKTSELENLSLSKDFCSKYKLYELKGFSYERIMEILKNPKVLSFYQISRSNESYLIVTRNIQNIKKELNIRAKEVLFSDFDKNDVVQTLIFRIFGSINKNYFLGDSYELSKIIDIDKKIISCFAFSVDNNVLEVKVNTYEKYESVLKSFESNKSKQKRIKKKQRFDEINGVLVRSDKGDWIKYRSMGSKKNKKLLSSASIHENITKMDLLDTFVKDIGEDQLKFFDFKTKDFRLFAKKEHWANKKNEYDKDIDMFEKKNSIEFMDETVSKKAIERIEESYKNKETPEVVNKVLDGLENRISSDIKIIIIDNKDYFKRRKQKDNYESLKVKYPNSQMITIQEIETATTTSLTSIFKNILKELMIKKNIESKSMFYFAHQLNYHYYKVFEEENGEKKLLSLAKKGEKIQLEEKKLDEMSLREPKLNNFLTEKGICLEDAEGLCIIGSKHYLIERTKIAALPNYEKIVTEKEEVSRYLSTKITSEHMDKILSELKNECDKKKEGSKIKETILKKLNVLESYYDKLSKEEYSLYSLTKLSKEDDCLKFLVKTLRETLRIYADFKIVPKLRSEVNFKENVYSSFIYLWSNENHYYSGDSSVASSEYNGLNYIYKVSCSEIDDDFLTLLDNVYVKHKGIANKPFPDKYLNEYYKTIQRS